MKYIIILLFIVILSFSASAQMFTALTYNMGFTVGETKDFVNDYSWRGMGFDIRNISNDRLAFGASFSWNVFDERSDDLIQVEGGGENDIPDATISGTQIRYLNSFPLLLTANYYLGNIDSRVRPIIGLGVGTIYSIERLEIGIVAFQQKKWRFALAPEIGFVIPSFSGTSFNVNARYYYGFPVTNDITNEKTSVQYVGINVGFAFTYDVW